MTETTTCIFCPKAPDSKEDMYPRWIHRSVDSREPLARRIGDAEPVITEDKEVRIQCVCGTCNNEWMSRLETKCKPLIGSLLEDLSLSLDAEQRKFLTEWAVKTAMVTDAYEGHVRFFTDSECHAFKNNNREIPNGLAVWAGRFTGRSLSAIASEFRMDSPTTQGVARGQVFTILVGHLILQLLCVHAQTAVMSVELTPTELDWDSYLIPLWPPLESKTRKLTWPPKHSFSVVENTNLGNLHYARLLYRWNVKYGHTVQLATRSTESTAKS